MCKRLVPLLLMLLAAPSLRAQQAPTPAEKTPPAENKLPPDAAKLPNPVKPSAASIAQGKKIYGYDCAMCHGADGDGKGDLAADMKFKLADFRDPASLKNMTDGEMFNVIKNGKGEMPSEGDRAKTDDIWNLVNYIRSLAKKDTAAKP